MASNRGRMSEYVAMLHADAGVAPARTCACQQLPPMGMVHGWELATCTQESKVFIDFTGCVGSVSYHRVFSSRFRDLIDAQSSPLDSLQWLPILIRNGTGEEREYFILHFVRPLDAIDQMRTIFNPASKGEIIRPAFRQDTLVGHKIFIYPHQTVGVSVSRDIAIASVEKGMTGVTFGNLIVV